jgi:hypothetical protein
VLGSLRHECGQTGQLSLELQLATGTYPAVRSRISEVDNVREEAHDVPAAGMGNQFTLLSTGPSMVVQLCVEKLVTCMTLTKRWEKLEIS